MSDILVGRRRRRRRRRDGLVLVAAHFRFLLAAGPIGCAPRDEYVLRFKLGTRTWQIEATHIAMDPGDNKRKRGANKKRNPNPDVIRLRCTDSALDATQSIQVERSIKSRFITTMRNDFSVDEQQRQKGL